jgi:hypothetical protein
MMILDLQRTAGNAATARMLGRAVSVQRFKEKEWLANWGLAVKEMGASGLLADPNRFFKDAKSKGANPPKDPAKKGGPVGQDRLPVLDFGLFRSQFIDALLTGSAGEARQLLRQYFGDYRYKNPSGAVQGSSGSSERQGPLRERRRLSPAAAARRDGGLDP